MADTTSPFSCDESCPKCGSKYTYRLWYDLDGEHISHRCHCCEYRWAGEIKQQTNSGDD